MTIQKLCLHYELMSAFSLGNHCEYIIIRGQATLHSTTKAVSHSTAVELVVAALCFWCARLSRLRVAAWGGSA